MKPLTRDDIKRIADVEIGKAEMVGNVFAASDWIADAVLALQYERDCGTPNPSSHYSLCTQTKCVHGETKAHWITVDAGTCFATDGWCAGPHRVSRKTF